MINNRTTSTLSDEELLEKYKASDRIEYFGELYNRYIPLIYGLCLKYLRNSNKSQDAVMQLFEDLIQKIPGQRINVFRTWIYTVAKNHCLQIIRQENKEIFVESKRELMESEEVLHLLCEEDPYDERMETLRRCMERLPDSQRISIIHFFMNECSYADIVDRTGYSLNAVKSNIQNGRRNLKNCIKKQSR